MYRNSVDALRNLLSDEHRTSEVIQISAKSGGMQNGIPYCVVQISFANGEEYRIEDYGEAAGSSARPQESVRRSSACTDLILSIMLF